VVNAEIEVLAVIDRLGDALTRFVCSRRDARTEAALRSDSNDRLPRTAGDIFLHPTPETGGEVRTDHVV
jgi:hypothetical protein